VVCYLAWGQLKHGIADWVLLRLLSNCVSISFAYTIQFAISDSFWYLTFNRSQTLTLSFRYRANSYICSLFTSYFPTFNTSGWTIPLKSRFSANNWFVSIHMRKNRLVSLIPTISRLNYSIAADSLWREGCFSLVVHVYRETRLGFDIFLVRCSWGFSSFSSPIVSHYKAFKSEFFILWRFTIFSSVVDILHFLFDLNTLFGNWASWSLHLAFFDWTLRVHRYYISVDWQTFWSLSQLIFRNRVQVSMVTFLSFVKKTSMWFICHGSK